VTIGPLGAADRGQAQAAKQMSIMRDAIFGTDYYKAAWFAFHVTIVDPCETATLSWTPVAIPDI